VGGYKIKNQDSLHFVTFTVVGWIDVFTREMYVKTLIESLNYCVKNKGLKIHAYVIMSNHLHLIISTPFINNLSSVIRDFKSFTSKKIILQIKENKRESRRDWMIKLFKQYAKNNKRNLLYQFWKQDNRPIELISPKWINQKLNYIHNNPVRAGIIEIPEHYIYSSANIYAGQEGDITIEKLESMSSIGYISM